MGSISELAEESGDNPVTTKVEELAPVVETSTDFKTPSAEERIKTITETKPTDKPSVLEQLLTRIEPITESKTKLKLMIYSDPGAGKTTLTGQIPNNLIIDAEEGTQSILNHPELMAKGVARLPYKTFGGLELAVEEFHKGQDALKQFETISIDSLSNLHKRGLAEVVEREWKKAPTLKNRYVAETEQHTENNEHIRRLVQSLCDLPLNLVLTAHSRTIEPKDQAARTFPDFSEKLANTIAGMMDIVGYMFFAQVEGKQRRVLRFHPSPTVMAKCRWKAFPENMVDPTWEKIRAIIDN
jgi:phage nucleotide-binding protein